MQPLFLFDVGSPNAYLAHRVLPEVERRTGTQFQYLPVLLGGLFKLTGNQSPAMAYASIPSKLSYEQKEMARFIQRHGLNEFKWNPHFPVNTLTMMRVAVAAERADLLRPCADALFRGLWEQQRKLDEPAAIAEVLGSAGLPAEALLQAAGDDEVKAKLIANTQWAFEQGAFGAPTFIVGRELFFGKDRLDQVEDAILASRNPATA